MGSRSSDTLRRTSKSSQKNRQINMGQRGLLLFVAINVFFIFSTTIVSGKSISKDKFGLMRKRSMDFMGTHVSYPQYLRLVAIQREVIRMDVTIRSMLQNYDPIELSQNPYWIELLELYNSLKKMLPEKYIETMGTDAGNQLYEDEINSA